MKVDKSVRQGQQLVEQGLVVASAAMDAVIHRFGVSITPELIAAIDKTHPQDPIALQFVPSLAELHDHPLERFDPIGDEAHSPVPGIVHRYPDRCLLIPVKVCPVYCRFCFRKETVGNNATALTDSELMAALAYIEATPSLWEVILTGGDPLIMKANRIAFLLDRLNRIDHVGVIRIHTRVPVVDTQRISDELIAILQSSKKPITLLLHINHVNELSPAAIKVIQKLHQSGITLLSQSVLLKNVNDDLETLTNLMRAFVQHRIKPHYLHHLDLTRGTSHFRTSIAHGLELMRGLEGRLSGLCQPKYMLDIPGGFGKVCLTSNKVRQDSNNPHHYWIEDYDGVIHSYSDLSAD